LVGQPCPALHALLATHVPAELHTSPIGHGAFGPHWLIVIWHWPERHAWPEGQSASIVHAAQAPLVQAWQAPFTQTEP